MAQLDEDAVNVSLIVDLCVWYKRMGSVGAARRAAAAAGAGRGERGGVDDNGNSGNDNVDTRGDRGDALAVLVFLPGTKEIADVQEALLQSRAFGCLESASQRAWVLPLHGGLPPEDQRRVFEKPVGPEESGGGGSRVVKVILSTNVAEVMVLNAAVVLSFQVSFSKLRMTVIVEGLQAS
jgi:hypothetical protein